ncbi:MULTISPECIES: helix-turn-helix domain-containing protein [unclassified Janthinobacterium]|uniref:helix-turn-helix domain-containing protein n=1 Tax=unclassified Janthinobacterium TaxID=2610881 RepID=UPI001C58A7F4|nr:MULTISPECIES: helix-turn-helix domain-containing protein [unclassified Janthinobacterium]QYG08306.1 helix-turn-helix domain-containing protein [Janthinobacterium sp. PAMC25594]
MALVSDHPLHLLGLRFPLRLRVTVRQGFVTLHNEITTKKLGSGDSFVVPAFLRFACDVMPGRGKPAVFTLALEDDEAEGGHGGGKRWSQALAQHIFDTPQGKWTAARLATLWQVTPHKARARLFAEGEALLSLVREQRLAHALHTAAQAGADGEGGERDLAQVAAGSGFASIPAFCDACVDVAGVRPSLFLRGQAPG